MEELRADRGRGAGAYAEDDEEAAMAVLDVDPSPRLPPSAAAAAHRRPSQLLDIHHIDAHAQTSAASARRTVKGRMEEWRATAADVTEAKALPVALHTAAALRYSRALWTTTSSERGDWTGGADVVRAIAAMERHGLVPLILSALSSLLVSALPYTGTLSALTLHRTSGRMAGARAVQQCVGASAALRSCWLPSSSLDLDNTASEEWVRNINSSSGKCAREMSMRSLVVSATEHGALTHRGSSTRSSVVKAMRLIRSK